MSSGGDVRKLRLAREVEVSLELARQRLARLPQPLEFATEHILLGLASADHAVALWLRQKGLDPERLEAEICKLHGCSDTSQISAVAWDDEPGEPAPQRPNDATPIRPSVILDAAANRAHEGLRVIEDYIRFVLDDQHLARLCKQLRHDFTSAIRRLPLEDRLTARDTLADVGASLTTPEERQRADAADVLAANFSRLQEFAQNVGGVRQDDRPRPRRNIQGTSLSDLHAATGGRTLRDRAPNASPQPSSTFSSTVAVRSRSLIASLSR